MPDLQDLRKQVLRGERLAPEDYHQVVEDIRQNRRSAAQSKAAKEKKVANPEDLFATPVEGANG